MEDRPKQVELNTADAAQLATLPGVTPRLAKRIVRHRLRHGPFGDISELRNVRGFGPPQLHQQVAELAYVAYPPISGSRVIFGSRAETEARPVVFSGSPEYLQGQIELANAGTQEARITGIRVENTDVRDSAGGPLTEIRMRARLAPGAQGRTDLAIALDPRMPPGVYNAELVIGEERRSVVFNVAEKITAQVSPARLVFLNEPNSRVEKQLFVTNTGNLPLRDGGVTAVAVEEENLICRIARNSTKRLNNPSLDDLVGAVSDELKVLFEEVELLRVTTKNKPSEILPGDTGTFVLEFQLPGSLRKGKFYRGRFRLFDTGVEVVINPGHVEKEKGGEVKASAPSRRKETE